MQNCGKESEKINSILGLKNGKIVFSDTKACLEHISIKNLKYIVLFWIL